MPSGVFRLLFAALCLSLAACDRITGSDPLVVYCAHDAVYSQAILEKFEQQTGIDVEPRFDTEATKSLGLVEMIARERDNPRCDVFWNNELLGTLALAEQDLLEPYRGEGYARIPDRFKDPQGRWTGFAARLRVWIINTNLHEATRDAIARTLEQDDLSQVTIAKPLYGTTRTHYTVLWDRLGPDALQFMHNDWRRRGIIEAPSNGRTMDLVSQGTCAIGWTDTDDYFVAKDDGLPVTMLPVRIGEGEVICIPNTVMIVKGTSKRDQARQLIDFLLSEQIELELANSKSRQIPLGPVDEASLSQDVRAFRSLVNDGYPLTQLDTAVHECLAWLKAEYQP
jgi:iron(III) transport system substrate-binding protein